MLGAVLIRVKGMVLLAVLTLALVATGFAHRLPSQQDSAVQAYLAAGGTLADLCADTNGNGDIGHPDCIACQIASTLMPSSGTLTLRAADLVFVAAVVAPRESRALRHVPDPARSSQSPPLV